MKTLLLIIISFLSGYRLGQEDGKTKLKEKEIELEEILERNERI